MKKVILLVFLGLVVASAASKYSPLQQIELLAEKSSFGSYVSNLVQLNLEQKNPFEQIVSMLSKLIDGLVNQQTVADNEHSKTSATLANNIETLENSIEDLHEEQTTTNRLVVTLAEEIAGLASTVATQQRQVTTISSQLNNLAEQRQNEKGEYDRRIAAYNRMLNAVITVQTKLTAAVLDRQGTVLLEVEQKNVIGSLKKELGDKHPIVLMAEMTSKFDEKTATKVIEKLEQIAKNLSNSIQGEDERELAAQQTFNTANGQLTEVLNNYSKELYQNTKVLAYKKNDLMVRFLLNKDQLKSLMNQRQVNNYLLPPAINWMLLMQTTKPHQTLDNQKFRWSLRLAKYQSTTRIHSSEDQPNDMFNPKKSLNNCCVLYINHSYYSTSLTFFFLGLGASTTSSAGYSTMLLLVSLTQNLIQSYGVFGLGFPWASNNPLLIKAFFLRA